MFRADFYAVVAQVVPVLMLVIFLEAGSAVTRPPRKRPKIRAERIFHQARVPIWAINGLIAEVLALIALYRQKNFSVRWEVALWACFSVMLLLLFTDIHFRNRQAMRRLWGTAEETDDDDDD